MTNGFSANLHLFEDHPELANDTSVHGITLATPGVMYGPARVDMQFPQSTVFAPYLLLHNEAKQTRTVAVTASYTQAGTGRKASLATVTLQPDTTRTVPLTFKDITS